jgi:dTDP-glucose 4,6-dehydratase
MRIVITGGAGFIASHLTDYLIDRGHSVVAIDNLITGELKNIQHLFGSKKYSFIRHDVTNFTHVPGRVDAVLHFASPASPRDYLEYPIPTLKVGALGTHKALGMAKEKKATFLLASTSEVYGDPQVNPQPEAYWGNVNPIGPRGVYDEAKRFAEAMTMAYHRYHKMQVRIVRIFNTYGPRMRIADGRAIPNFISQALRGKPLTIYGSGRQTRSFCYVSDTVAGLYKLLMSRYNAPVNIGNPHQMTLNMLAQHVLRLSHSRSRIAHRPLPEDDPRIRQPDIRLARRLLRWQPEVALEDGLRQTIDYFRQAMRSR